MSDNIPEAVTQLIDTEGTSDSTLVEDEEEVVEVKFPIPTLQFDQKSAISAPSGTSNAISYNNTETTNISATTSKIELPPYTEHDTNAETWVRRCLYNFQLYQIVREPVMVARMLSALPNGLQPSVQNHLSRSVNTADQTTVAKFQEALISLTKKSATDIERDLDKCTYDPGKFPHFRDFLYKIRSFVEQQLPSTTPNDVLEITVKKEFKKRVPPTIKNNITFNMSEEDGLRLADLAQRIYSLTNISSNNLRTTKKDSNKESNNFHTSKKSDQNRSNFAKNRQGVKFSEKTNYNNRSKNYISAHSGQKFTGPKNTGQTGQSGKSPTCFFCQIPGHRWTECRKLEKAKSEKIVSSNWTPFSARRFSSPQNQNN